MFKEREPPTRRLEPEDIGKGALREIDQNINAVAERRVAIIKPVGLSAYTQAAKLFTSPPPSGDSVVVATKSLGG